MEFAPAGPVPIQQLVQRLVPPCEAAADAKALEHDAFIEQDAGVAQALAFAAVVLRDLPADGHARIDVEAGQNGVQNIAADVVGIDVDTFRRRLASAGPIGPAL